MTRLVPAAVCCLCCLAAPALAQSPASQWRAAARDAERIDAANARIVRALHERPLTVRFDATPARAAFAHVGTVLGVPIAGAWADDRVGPGIDREAPITLDAFDQPGLTVLEMMLEQCADGADRGSTCTWQVRRGRLELGTRDRLDARPEVRLYDVHDLLTALPMFDNAPGIDIDAALNQGLGGLRGGSAGSGGGGGPGGFGGGGSGSGGLAGGGIIEPPGDEPPRPGEGPLADQLVAVIVAAIEPEVWLDDHVASIRHRAGVLVVRAPAYVHRQLEEPNVR